MNAPSSRLPLGQLLFCGAFVVTLSMGVRHSFGLWLQPITMAHGWTREDYSIALAIQNLVWGASGPFVGWWADRSGAFKVLWLGALLYALGLAGMATSSGHITFLLSTGLMIGLAQACTTYAVIYGVIGRNVSVQQRSWAMGITAAAGSFGQFLMVPVASVLIHNFGWSHALISLAGTVLVICALAFGLREARSTGQPARMPLRTTSADTEAVGSPVSSASNSPATYPAAAHLATSPANFPGNSPATSPATSLPPSATPATAHPQPAVHAAQTARDALAEALGHRDYLLLTAGYFVCGFQLAFIGVHLPSYLKDHQIAPQMATTALALIGLFNVFGSYAAGSLGTRIRKTWILSTIYLGRALAMTLFVLTPLSSWSIGLFAATMGALWLSTVPPTNAIVAQMHGVKHLSMLGGIVFFSHQIGSFLGVWLAGHIYDLTGSYDLVWWIAVALGVFAGLVNMPIQEHRTPASRPIVAA